MMVFNARSGAKTAYLALLAVQIIGAVFLITTVLPDFRQLALYPGEQLPYMRGDDFALIVALVIMQVAYCIVCSAFQFRFRVRAQSSATYFCFWVASASFSVGRYSPSSSSDIF